MNEYEYEITHVDVHGNEGEATSKHLLVSIAPWSFENTLVNHTVDLPSDLFLQMSGQGIQYGDYIGAFVEVDGELVCLGQTMWNEFENSIVLQMDESTIGSSIVWVIYDASVSAEYTAVANYDNSYPQTATMLNGGLSQVLEFNIDCY